jgi:hypothetical protein
MDIATLRDLFDRELRRDIEYPDMRKDVLPNVVRFVRPAPGMSFILYSCLDENNADEAIAEQVAFFRPRNQRFEWKVYDHDTPPDHVERLISHGFEAEEEPEAVMVLDLQEAPPALLEPVSADVRRVTSTTQLPDVITVLENVWGADFSWITTRHPAYMQIPGYFSSYIAHLDQQPASVGWTFFYPNSHFAGLWGGSTVAKFRGRGLYKALLATRVQEAVQRGYRFLTIDTSPMSRPIVARHGFRLLAYARACEWMGMTDSGHG